MYRIDSLGFLVNANGVGKNGFSDGDAAAGVRGTELEDAWLNELQEELANVVEATGVPLAKLNRSQLSDAVRRLMLPLALSNWAGLAVWTGSPGLIQEVFWKRANGRIIAASQGGASGELKTSDDGGNTWTTRTKPNTNTMGAFADNGSNIIIAPGQTNGSNFRSVDGGNTWTFQALTGAPAAVAGCHVWVPTLNLFVAYFNNNTVYTSPDGITWTLAYSVGGGQFINKMIWTGQAIIGIGTVGSGAIWRSTNGTTWTRPTFTVPTSAVVSNTVLRNIAVNTTSGRVIAVGYDGGTPSSGVVTISNDHGLTWSPTTPMGGGLNNLNQSNGPLPGVSTRYAGGICCDPLTREWVMMFDGGNILTSNDDGESWHRRYQGVGTLNAPGGTGQQIDSVMSRRVLVGMVAGAGTNVLASMLNRS